MDGLHIHKQEFMESCSRRFLACASVARLSRQKELLSRTEYVHLSSLSSIISVTNTAVLLKCLKDGGK